jgi:hypothetical protein
MLYPQMTQAEMLYQQQQQAQQRAQQQRMYQAQQEQARAQQQAALLRQAQQQALYEQQLRAAVRQRTCALSRQASAHTARGELGRAHSPRSSPPPWPQQSERAGGYATPQNGKPALSSKDQKKAADKRQKELEAQKKAQMKELERRRKQAAKGRPRSASQVPVRIGGGGHSLVGMIPTPLSSSGACVPTTEARC